ncbi:hypothetical protein F2Q69_00012038 [Brassica cretica]|uniref:Uncharacterized protein n=1 Tax=Brassica cretica TaxID=69181 RepID=A0A8S9R1H9_BRACR|nr:hypothetical protein F2Q69_00012038 [Brassica cretica]
MKVLSSTRNPELVFPLCPVPMAALGFAPSFPEISLPWSDARLGFVSDPRPPTFSGWRGVVMPARQLCHTTVRGLLVVPIPAEASELSELSFNTDYSGSNRTIRKVMNNGGNADPLS